MTQNDQDNQQQQPQLCLKCNDMYGHANFEDMCSLCYKKEKNLQQIISKPTIADQHSEDELPIPQASLQEVGLKRQLPREEERQQLPKGKCAKCSKKTGMLGFTCKHCSTEFCRLHRLPEEHSCGVDFVSLGRKKIKSQNPLILTKKIEDI